jgi:transposase-like protein
VILLCVRWYFAYHFSLRDLEEIRRGLKPGRIEQDHRCIKRRIQLLLGFKSPTSAAIILDGIEMVHMAVLEPFGTYADACCRHEEAPSDRARLSAFRNAHAHIVSVGLIPGQVGKVAPEYT